MTQSERMNNPSDPLASAEQDLLDFTGITEPEKIELIRHEWRGAAERFQGRASRQYIAERALEAMYLADEDPAAAYKGTARGHRRKRSATLRTKKRQDYSAIGARIKRSARV